MLEGKENDGNGKSNCNDNGNGDGVYILNGQWTRVDHNGSVGYYYLTRRGERRQETGDWILIDSTLKYLYLYLYQDSGVDGGIFSTNSYYHTSSTWEPIVGKISEQNPSQSAVILSSPGSKKPHLQSWG